MLTNLSSSVTHRNNFFPIKSVPVHAFHFLLRPIFFDIRKALSLEIVTNSYIMVVIMLCIEAPLS